MISRAHPVILDLSGNKNTTGKGQEMLSRQLREHLGWTDAEYIEWLEKRLGVLSARATRLDMRARELHKQVVEATEAIARLDGLSDRHQQNVQETDGLRARMRAMFARWAWAADGPNNDVLDSMMSDLLDFLEKDKGFDVEDLIFVFIDLANLGATKSRNTAWAKKWRRVQAWAEKPE